MVDVVPVVERLLEGLLAERVHPARREQRVEGPKVAGVGRSRDDPELARDRKEDPAVVEARGNQTLDEGT